MNVSMKPPAWSYSRLTSYEQCPKKFYHLSVSKDVKEKPNTASLYGTEVHKALHERISKNKKFPLHLSHLEPIAAKFTAATGDKLSEQQLAINQDMKPTGWFDSDVWARAIIDLAVINGDRALLVDWKTGKMSDDFTQQRAAAAIFFIYFPEVRVVDLMYYWLKDKKPTVEELKREDIKHVWAPLIKRIQRYTEAHKTTDFPPRQSGLCKNYCPVTSCPFNGA